MISPMEWGAWEAQIEFHTYFIISSVGRAAWKTQDPWTCNVLSWFLQWSGKRGKANIIDNTLISIDFSWVLRCSGEHERPRNIENALFSHLFVMISSVRWGAWKGEDHWTRTDFFTFSWFLQWSGKRGKPRIIEHNWFPYTLHDFFGEVGSEGSPESLKTYWFP